MDNLYKNKYPRYRRLPAGEHKATGLVRRVIPHTGYCGSGKLELLYEDTQGNRFWSGVPNVLGCDIGWYED